MKFKWPFFKKNKKEKYPSLENWRPEVKGNQINDLGSQPKYDTGTENNNSEIKIKNSYKVGEPYSIQPNPETINQNQNPGDVSEKK